MSPPFTLLSLLCQAKLGNHQWRSGGIFERTKAHTLFHTRAPEFYWGTHHCADTLVNLRFKKSLFQNSTGNAFRISDFEELLYIWCDNAHTFSELFCSSVDARKLKGCWVVLSLLRGSLTSHSVLELFSLARTILACWWAGRGQRKLLWS